MMVADLMEGVRRLSVGEKKGLDGRSRVRSYRQQTVISEGCVSSISVLEVSLDPSKQTVQGESIAVSDGCRDPPGPVAEGPRPV